MNTFHLSDNILKLRRQRNMTQEELADFIGVTKASVSKWETKQSLPDILLLPQLASFFDVTVDELIGYEPQLSKEQIQKYYIQFTSEFAEKSFEDVMKKTEKMVKKYYSCYPFLFQICVLWLNHYNLAGEKDRQFQILNQAARLCKHIMEHCQDSGVCSDAIMLKAMIDLQCGRAQEVVDVLEDMTNPYHLHHGETILIQAYQMLGKTTEAHRFTQFSMYSSLLVLVGYSIQYMSVHMSDFDICYETIKRIDQIIDIYHLNQLDSNTVAQYQYQCAMVYCIQNNNSEALKRLESYVKNVCHLLSKDHIFSHGDDYFDAISYYYENSDLGVNPVRDKKLILTGAIQALDNPIFSCLGDTLELKSIKDILLRRSEEL